MYQVIFLDYVMGEQTESFDTPDEATEFFDQFINTETCCAGWIIDDTNEQVIKEQINLFD